MAEIVRSETKEERTVNPIAEKAEVLQMQNYDIFDDPYDTTYSTGIERENDRLVLVGIEEMLGDTEERIDEIAIELVGLRRQLSKLKDRFEEINAKMN